MFRIIFKYSVILTLVGFLGACANNRVYHEGFMRGQIVGVDGDQVVLCIGREGGAQIGMRLEVFEVVSEGSMMDSTDSYRLEIVGEVEIESIIDKHFARAHVMYGSIQSSNVVQFRDE